MVLESNSLLSAECLEVPVPRIDLEPLEGLRGGVNGGLVVAHTRKQAKDFLAAIETQEERARTLGVRPASEITTEALCERYKRHQKVRIRPSTFERWGGILETLKRHLPERVKAISKQTIAKYIESRSETVKPGTVAKEMSVLKHCLKLACEWELIHENPAAGARLPSPQAVQNISRRSN
jgi:hypothetical protein